MKLFNIKTTLFAAAVALVFTLIACNTDSLLKDVNIEVGTELLYNPVNLQIVDARMDGKIPQNATVTIIGKDKDKVFSVFGEKALAINNEGILNIGIPRSYKPTATAPLEFMVVVNAPGFLEARKNISIRDVKKQVLDQVRMVNLASPPKGVSIESSAVIPVNATTGVSQDIVFSTPSATGKTENATVKIATGTKMFDKDGNAVSGDVKLTLVHFDATNESSISNFPGGLSFNSVVDAKGNSLGSGVFTPFGFASMNMSVNGKEVKTFSQPLDIDFDINPNAYRPLFKRNVQAGDTIPVMSFNESNASWNAETYAVVTNQNGKLKASFKQKHLSWWSVQDMFCDLMNIMAVYFPNNFSLNPASALCESCGNPSIKILSDITASSSRKDFYAELRAYGPNPTMIWGGQNIDLSDGVTLDLFGGISGVSKFMTVSLVVYDKEPWNGGKSLYTSPPISPCQNAAIDLKGQLPKDLFDATKTPIINLNFSGICAGASANDPSAIIKPSATIMYQEIGVDVTSRVLGQIVEGKGSGTGLIPGHKYRFSVSYGKLSTSTDDLGLKDGFLMPSGDATIAVKSAAWGIDQTFTIKKEGNAYNLNYEGFQISEKLCTEYKKYF